jgi:hypothetical protein
MMLQHGMMVLWIILQTYFYDEDEQAELRAQLCRNENDVYNQQNLSLFHSIHQALLECGNTYLQSFLCINEVIQQMPFPPEEIKISIHADMRPSLEHRRCYNLPECSEVSILMPNIVVHDEQRQLICSFRQSEAEFNIVSDTHRSYDPLAYPLFYPYGSDGWSLRYLQM